MDFPLELFLSVLGLFPLFLAIFWYLNVPNVSFHLNEGLYGDMFSPLGNRYNYVLLVCNHSNDDIVLTEFRVFILREKDIMREGDIVYYWELGQIELEPRYRSKKFKGKEFNEYVSDIFVEIDAKMENGLLIAAPSLLKLKNVEKYYMISISYKHTKTLLGAFGIEKRVKKYIKNF